MPCKCHTGTYEIIIGEPYLHCLFSRPYIKESLKPKFNQRVKLLFGDQAKCHVSATQAHTRSLFAPSILEALYYIKESLKPKFNQRVLKICIWGPRKMRCKCHIDTHEIIMDGHDLHCLFVEALYRGLVPRRKIWLNSITKCRY